MGLLAEYGGWNEGAFAAEIVERQERKERDIGFGIAKLSLNQKRGFFVFHFLYFSSLAKKICSFERKLLTYMLKWLFLCPCYGT